MLESFEIYSTPKETDHLYVFTVVKVFKRRCYLWIYCPYVVEYSVTSPTGERLGTILTHNIRVVKCIRATLFSVTVQPWDFSMTGPTGVIEEGTVEQLTCTADGGKPPPNMEWTVIGRDITQSKKTLHNIVVTGIVSSA